MLALAIEFSRCSRVAPSKLNSVSEQMINLELPCAPDEMPAIRIANGSLERR